MKKENLKNDNKEQEQELVSSTEGRQKISDELADILFFVLRFSEKYEFDLTDCFLRKMKKNAERYSVEKFKGKNIKAD